VVRASIVSGALIASAMLSQSSCTYNFDDGAGGAGSGQTGIGSASTSNATTGTTAMGGMTVSTGATTSAGMSGKATSGGVTASSSTGGDCTTNCENAHPAGYMVIQHAILKSCGCLDNSPCEATCAATPACTSDNSPDTACETCLQSLYTANQHDACVTQAADSLECQSDTDCSALVGCILAC
jgi:hypothetical protein